MKRADGFAHLSSLPRPCAERKGARRPPAPPVGKFSAELDCPRPHNIQLDAFLFITPVLPVGAVAGNAERHQYGGPPFYLAGIIILDPLPELSRTARPTRRMQMNRATLSRRWIGQRAGAPGSFLFPRRIGPVCLQATASARRTRASTSLSTPDTLHCCRAPYFPLSSRSAR